MYQRTTVSVMQKEPGAGAMIHSYSPRGFNIDGNRVFGPCAVLPPAILQWNVGKRLFNIFLTFPLIPTRSQPFMMVLFFHLSSVYLLPVILLSAE